MPVTITSAADSDALNVLGEELRPLTPAGLSVQVFETSAPGEKPGEAGPPPHRHAWDEVYVVLGGILEVFDGEAWREAKAGACVTVPGGQWHAYRNGTADCRFLTITSPGRAREFFESSAAELSSQPDMDVAAAIAARHDVEVLPPPGAEGESPDAGGKPPRTAPGTTSTAPSPPAQSAGSGTPARECGASARESGASARESAQTERVRPEPVLPDQSHEDTDIAWGDYPESDTDRLYRDRPPHWADY